MRPGKPRAQTRRGRPRRPGGFTLIELLVVITVIAILAAIVLAAVGVGRQTSSNQATKNVVHQVGLAIAAFSDQHDKLPPETDGGLASGETLAKVLGQYKDQTTPGGGYLALSEHNSTDIDDDDNREVSDAFGQPLVYNRWLFTHEMQANPRPADTHQPIHNPKRYDLFSVGPLASRLSEFKLSSYGTFEANAVEYTGNATKYKHEEEKVGGRLNKYIGNW